MYRVRSRPDLLTKEAMKSARTMLAEDLPNYLDNEVWAPYVSARDQGPLCLNPAMLQIGTAGNQHRRGQLHDLERRGANREGNDVK